MEHLRSEVGETRQYRPEASPGHLLMLRCRSFRSAAVVAAVVPRHSAIVAILLALSASSTLAHTGSAAGGFVGGFVHPLLGIDHMVAMVAVGLWGAFLGAPAIWLLPIVFPMVMALGGAIAILSVPLPGVETGIAASAVVLGLMVALAARPHLGIAALIVAAFAVFHGHAHGRELPAGADVVAYSIGFVVATGLLHLAGIVFGQLARWPAGRLAVRAAGGVIALAGAAFLGGIG